MTKKVYTVDVSLYNPIRRTHSWVKYSPRLPERSHVGEHIKNLMSRSFKPGEIRVRIETITEEVLSCCEFGTRKDLN